MAYESIDQLQKALAEEVFSHTKDAKKAAGRALGTLVEVITFYLLKTWGFGASVAIERGIEEYGNPDITHNVEYSLHPILYSRGGGIEGARLPITAKKIVRSLRGTATELERSSPSTLVLLTKEGVLRNACVVARQDEETFVAIIKKHEPDSFVIEIVGQYRNPFAIFECKRVGVEEGNRKGPQTIEKAKQGAYVARSVSSLQRIRSFSGELRGVIPKEDGALYCKEYSALIDEIIRSSSPDLLRRFVLTVGVVSNHGNWFTSENHNKELRVLAQSYDWLLFLTDQGLAEFIDRMLIRPSAMLKPAKEAFASSYAEGKKKNQFTKVQMNREADLALQDYFEHNSEQVESWFNVIAPSRKTIGVLKEELDMLRNKDWKRILGL
jgi:hypothetical protein